MEGLRERHATSSARAGASSGQSLNAMDCTMLAVEQALRSIGSPGFETQIFVWLDGRADVRRLRTALARLGRRYPVISSRLVEDGRDGTPRWRFRPSAECPLHETDLAWDGCESVHEFAAQVLSTPDVLSRRDPIQFHLLHRPDGRDVFLVQYSHTLMDNNAAVLLVREIERLSDPKAAAPIGPRVEERDLVAEYLRRFPRWRRLRAAWNVLNLRYRTLRRAPLTLGSVGAGDERPARFQFATRRLDVDETRAFKSRVMETCGFPSLSMALLASVFRAMSALAPDDRVGQDLIAGLGVDLGLRRPDGPIFQNLMSILPVRVRRDELHDRDALVRELNRHFRDRLAGDIDVGVLQLASLCRRRSWLVQRLLRRLLQHGYSLWYAYFGAADGIGPEFCGAPVEDVYYTASTWPPLGLMFVANQFRGRLLLQATYLPELVPPAVADELLETVLSDLRAGRAEPVSTKAARR